MEGCQGSGWHTTSHKHQEKDCFFVGGSLCDSFKLCGYFKLLLYKTAYGTLCLNNVPGLFESAHANHMLIPLYTRTALHVISRQYILGTPPRD